MAIRRLFFVVLLVWISAGSLAAQAEPERARKILNGNEYKGYRIHRPQPQPGSLPGDSELHDNGANSNDASSQGGGDGGYRGFRRGTGLHGDSGGGGLSLSPGAAQAIEVVMWIVLGIVAAAIVFVVVRLVLDRRPNMRLKQPLEDADDAEKPDHAPAPLDDISALEAELARALQDGDYGQASLIAYKLFWRRAGWTGFADARDVKTWRDACRLVKRSDMRQEVRKLLGLVERVRYGGHAPSAAEFEAWRRRLDAVDSHTLLA